MKGRIWIWVLGVVIVFVAAVVLVRKVSSAKSEVALQDQLRQARAEGLPTNWQEFAATIPTVAPSENAAPFYRELTVKKELRSSSFKVDPIAVANEVTFIPSAASSAAANQLLDQYKDSLGIANKAVLLPKCRFDRDWSQGLATLFPEFSQMKGVAKLFVLRGSVAASKGDVKGALENTRKVFVVAGHAGSEPTLLSSLLRDTIYAMGLRALVNWSFAHRDQPAYRDALKAAIDAFSPPDVRREHLDDLYGILAMIDLCSTPEGRRKLGMKEEDVGALQRLAPLLVDQTEAKVRIVRAERAYWAALTLPPKARRAPVETARSQMIIGLMAFPLAAKIYTTFGAGEEDGSIDREPRWESRKIVYLAAYRALLAWATHQPIQAADLVSPIDGTPVQYHVRGKQITFTVKGFELGLKVPPDDILKK